MTAEALGWYGSIFLWLLFTGIGVPPCPEEAGIIYAAGVTALHPDVKWWLAWPATGAGIVAADMVLYGIGRLWGRRLFDYRWVQRIVKPVFRRNRPHFGRDVMVVGIRTTDASFPSGHTASSFAAATAISAFYPKVSPLVFGLAAAEEIAG